MKLSELKKQIGRDWNDFQEVYVILKTKDNENKGFPYDYNFCQSIVNQGSCMVQLPINSYQDGKEVSNKQIDNIIRYPLRKFKFEKFFTEENNIVCRLYIAFEQEEVKNV